MYYELLKFGDRLFMFFTLFLEFLGIVLYYSGLYNDFDLVPFLILLCPAIGYTISYFVVFFLFLIRMLWQLLEFLFHFIIKIKD